MKGRGVNDAVTWEKKGSALYTARNWDRYQKDLTRGTNRLLNQIAKIGGHTVYIGIRKDVRPEIHDSRTLYRSTFELLLRRLDAFGASHGAQVLVVMDEHQDREALLDHAARMMYHNTERLQHLLEPPYEVESHRYLRFSAPTGYAVWWAGSARTGPSRTDLPSSSGQRRSWRPV